MNQRGKHIETILAIVLGSIAFSLIFDVKELLYVALGIGILAVLSPFIAKWVHKGWIGLSMVLGFINSHILLAVIFFIVLTPLALIRRMVGKDGMMLRKKERDTFFATREHTFEAKDLKNPW